MRYNDRIRIITTQKVPGELGDETKDVTSDWLECRITGVSQYVNMGVFGKYESRAVAIHFKGKLSDINYVLFHNIKRKPKAILSARKNTVVIISET